MKDYRITVKVRNNRILKAIEDAGGEPGMKWCKDNNLCYEGINSLINMTRSPLTAEGKLRSYAMNLCDVLGKLPEDLWSNEQLYPLERNYSEIEMDYAQVVGMLPSEQQFYMPDFSGIEQDEIKSILNNAISTLRQNEQKVIRMIFDEELSQKECAKQLNVSAGRISELLKRALRKLRFEKTLKPLEDILE